MEQIYFYNRPPFLNYHHPYLHQNDNNNGSVCILIGLIIIIICVLCYLFWNDKNRSTIYNKNTFASAQANEDYQKFMKHKPNNYTSAKAIIANMDSTKYANIRNNNHITPDNFE